MFEYGVTVGSILQSHAMGDNEGWINLITLYALKQGTHIFVHVCLPHLECQRLGESGTKI